MKLFYQLGSEERKNVMDIFLLEIIKNIVLDKFNNIYKKPNLSIDDDETFMVNYIKNLVSYQKLSLEDVYEHLVYEEDIMEILFDIAHKRAMETFFHEKDETVIYLEEVEKSISNLKLKNVDERQNEKEDNKEIKNISSFSNKNNKNIN